MSLAVVQRSHSARCISCGEVLKWNVFICVNAGREGPRGGRVLATSVVVIATLKSRQEITVPLVGKYVSFSQPQN